jgi:hypothetical protein
VFSVGDMSGDGYPDLAQINPDTGTIYVYSSGTGFSSILTSFSFGDNRGIFL